MTTRFVLPIALSLLAVGTPVWAQSHSMHDMAPAAADAAPGAGVVNAVDVATRKVNISHGAIKVLDWPAMPMDFSVAPKVDLSGIAAGNRVTFTLVKGADGNWIVDTIAPAAARR